MLCIVQDFGSQEMLAIVDQGIARKASILRDVWLSMAKIPVAISRK